MRPSIDDAYQKKRADGLNPTISAGNFCVQRPDKLGETRRLG